jgi:vibriolysin
MQSERRTRAIFATRSISRLRVFRAVRAPGALAISLLALALAAACLPGAAAAEKNRQVYSAGYQTSLPGLLAREEGGLMSIDSDVNRVYDITGDVYDAFRMFWNRDSYDGNGAPIQSVVHYSTGYCNAFWNGSLFVFGDGNPAIGCGSLARSLDAVAHEYSNALIAHESDLVYAGESGGIHHGLGDVFAAFVDAWVAGGRNGTLAPTPDTWTIGEDVVTPALRYLDDPAEDGSSLDFRTPNSGNVDVAYSSGILRLAFYLLAQGGVHPRGKSTVVVTGIGMEKAIRVFYRANTDFLTPNSSFAAARTASLQAAVALGLTAAEQASVADAWAAVGVSAPAQPDPTDVVLVNRVPVTGLSSESGGMKFFKLDVPTGASNLRFVLAGGTGDADLYVRRGSRPELSVFDCRSWGSTNAESCTFPQPAPGTYHVMLNAYTSYSGATLTGSYDLGPPPGDPYLVSGVPVANLTGASGSNRYFRIAAVPGRPLTIRIAGGTGDADLYVRFGSRPTTATYNCRPYLTTNNETCTFISPSAGDYYIMLRGYRAYSGVTLAGTN